MSLKCCQISLHLVLHALRVEFQKFFCKTFLRALRPQDYFTIQVGIYLQNLWEIFVDNNFCVWNLVKTIEFQIRKVDDNQSYTSSITSFILVRKIVLSKIQFHNLLDKWIHYIYNYTRIKQYQKLLTQGT